MLYRNYPLVLILLLACISFPVSGFSQAKTLPEPVTFSEHIAPIIWKNCVDCHRSGTGAPFEFTDYEQVKRKARLIEDVTSSRFMPKWIPVHDADIQFQNQRVTWGNKTTDEMAGCGVEVIPIDNKDFEKLFNAYHKFRIQQFRDMPMDKMYPLVYGEILRRYDTNKSGKINLFELPAMVNFWAKSEQQNRDNKAFEVERIFAHRVGGWVIGDTVQREARYYIAAGIVIGLTIIAGIVYTIVRLLRRSRNRQKQISH